MGKPYSLDPRKRVGAAIEDEMSGNQAASKLESLIRRAIGCMQRVDRTGSVEPSQVGGYKPKATSGEHALCLSGRLKDGDLAIRGICCELAGGRLKAD